MTYLKQQRKSTYIISKRLANKVFQRYNTFEFNSICVKIEVMKRLTILLKLSRYCGGPLQEQQRPSPRCQPVQGHAARLPDRQAKGPQRRHAQSGGLPHPAAHERERQLRAPHSARALRVLLEPLQQANHPGKSRSIAIFKSNCN